jgi:diguanylate cyclase (GGDEF)-like protein
MRGLFRLPGSLAGHLDDEIDGAEFRGLGRNAADGAWLLLLLASIYVLAAGPDLLRPLPAAAVIGLYVVFSLALRLLPRFRRETRRKIVVECLAMVAFITAFAISVPAHPGVLLFLYLFPVMIAALALGRRPTLAVTSLSVGAFLVAVLLRAPVTWPGSLAVAELVMVLTPFLLVAYLAAMLSDEIGTAMQRIRTLAETDELTGLANVRMFARVHRQEHERAIRHGRTYSVIVADLDGLQQIQEDLGRETGNRVVVVLANVIARLVRTTDAAARLGGETFVVMLAETDTEQAMQVCRRLRAAAERCAVESGDRKVRISVTAGAASYPGDAETPEDLIAAARMAMRAERAARKPLASGADAPRAELV